MCSPIVILSVIMIFFDTTKQDNLQPSSPSPWHFFKLPAQPYTLVRCLEFNCWSFFLQNWQISRQNYFFCRGSPNTYQSVVSDRTVENLSFKLESFFPDPGPIIVSPCLSLCPCLLLELEWCDLNGKRFKPSWCYHWCWSWCGCWWWGRYQFFVKFDVDVDAKV